MINNINSKGFSAIGFLISIASLAVIGGGVYYLWTESSHPELSENGSAQQSSASINATVAAAPTTGEFRSSLPKLVARGDALECHWRVQSDAPESPFNAGKLWTMGDMGRSTINATVNGVPIEATAIYKDNAAYTWMTFNADKKGFRFSQSKLEGLDRSLTTQQIQQADQVRREMIFNCRAWNPETEKFELPADVTFNEV